MNKNLFDIIDFNVLTDLINRDDVTDISCKNKTEIWVTSNTLGHYKDIKKIDQISLNKIALQIANKMGKEFNPTNPNLEGDIQSVNCDYRIAIVHEYLSVDGITMAIRKIQKKAYLKYDQLLSSGYITKSALDQLIMATSGKANILFIGETGCGKTELVKFLAQYINPLDVIVTIEDSLEFNIKKINPKASVTSFRIRPNFDYRKLIAMSLRLNVERIFLQEARGIEVKDLLDAMSSGHSVITTMHARGAQSVVSRIKQMIDDNETYESLQKRVYSLVDLVVYLDKINTSNGTKRFVYSITEFMFDNQTNQISDRLIYQLNKETIPFSDNLTSFLENKLRGIQW